MRASRRSLTRPRARLPLLPRNSKRSVAPSDVDVLIVQRGQPERAVLPRVLLVADADQGLLEQAHHRREDLVARHTAA